MDLELSHTISGGDTCLIKNCKEDAKKIYYVFDNDIPGTERFPTGIELCQEHSDIDAAFEIYLNMGEQWIL